MDPLMQHKIIPYPQTFLLASKNLSLASFRNRDILLPNAPCATTEATNHTEVLRERGGIPCRLYSLFSATTPKHLLLY